MSLKAAEVSTLLPFILDECMRLGGSNVFGAAFIGLGGALVKFAEQLKTYKCVVPDCHRVAMLKTVGSISRCSEAANMKLTLKSNLLGHLVKRTSRLNLHTLVPSNTERAVRAQRGADRLEPVFAGPRRRDLDLQGEIKEQRILQD